MPPALRNEDGSTPLVDPRNDQRGRSVRQKSPTAYVTHPTGFILVKPSQHTDPSDPNYGCLRAYLPAGDYVMEEWFAELTILRNRMIEDTHLEMGHQGFAKTYKNWFWPGMYRQVEDFCKTCHKCQMSKQSTQKPGKPGGTFRVMPLPMRPFESIAMDFIGPLNAPRGYRNII